MFKRVNKILNMIIVCVLAAFTGYGAYVYWDYKTRPEYYVWQSAPWYTVLLLYGSAVIIIVAAAVIIKIIIRKRLR